MGACGGAPARERPLPPTGRHAGQEDGEGAQHAPPGRTASPAPAPGTRALPRTPTLRATALTLRTTGGGAVSGRGGRPRRRRGTLRAPPTPHHARSPKTRVITSGGERGRPRPWAPRAKGSGGPDREETWGARGGGGAGAGHAGALPAPPSPGPPGRRAEVRGQRRPRTPGGARIPPHPPRGPGTFSFSSQLRGFPGASSIGPAAGREEQPPPPPPAADAGGAPRGDGTPGSPSPRSGPDTPRAARARAVGAAGRRGGASEQ